jgi:phage terminase small subunit
MAQRRITTRKLRPDEAHLALDEAKLGPAMLALSERRRAFVIKYLEMGVKANATEAARLAGYVDDPTAKVSAHRLLHDERVIAAIQEEARKRLQAGTLVATAYVLEVITDEKADPKDRLKASLALMDRGGLPGQSEHQVTVTRKVDRAEVIADIRRVCASFGMDPAIALGRLGHAVVDVDPVEHRESSTDIPFVNHDQERIQHVDS